MYDFFPTGALDENINRNWLKLEAEATSMVRGLTDAQTCSIGADQGVEEALIGFLTKPIPVYRFANLLDRPFDINDLGAG